MRIVKLLASSAVVAALASSLWAGPREIGWEDLVPPSEAIENPFEALSTEQLDKLRQILRVEADASGDMAKKAQVLRAELAADGLDVDALFAKREEIIENRSRAASAVSEELIGEVVRVPGYILPLAFNGGRAVEFLLVPSVGACIHTPPPPANQMVHVRYPEGIVVKALYTPVWVTGPLGVESTIQKVTYSDGQSDVAVSYTMQPDAVVLY